MFGLSKLELYLIGALVLLIIVGAAVWHYDKIIAENASLKSKVAQLQQNVKDKDTEIKILHDTDELKSKTIDDNQAQVQALQDHIDDILEDMKDVKGGDAPASEYMKDFFTKLLQPEKVK